MKTAGLKAFGLPPLILHPFATFEENSLLVESSRASLAIQGFASPGQTSPHDLDLHLLRGRYAELKMLFYIGKDVCRWTEQCAETVIASGLHAGRKLTQQTFAVLLVEQPPNHVREKLVKWGVLDFSSLFRRSFGLHAVFGELPSPDAFSPDFLKRYHRYVDEWYEQRLKDQSFDRSNPAEFTFDLYASGEYSSMLEKSWADTANEG